METGVCYFPEHWPRERWAADVDAMAAAGIEYVRMGEFAWGRIEPERGTIRLDWLADAVELVADRDMRAIVCTPTATPPKWLVDEHPEVRAVDADGTPREWGSRRYTCFTSPRYREETERIVRIVAERFADHPGVAAVQIDNEYGCHRTTRCYCDDCAAAFREWLADRYGDVATLNEAWGTTFWSQQYPSFDAVDPPGPTPTDHHPSRVVDYARFAAAAVADYNRLQADLLREANDDWLLTHNFMGDFPEVDVAAVAADLDVVAWDSYPTGFVQDRRPGEATAAELRAGDPDQVSLNHDRYRGAGDAPFWVLEQQPGDVNWPPYGPQPAAGAVRLWSHHAVAHGADVVSYFRWRRCLEGQEQYHAGLRRRDGSPDRGYDEATRAAAEFDALGELAPVDAPVAVCHAPDDWWALAEQPAAPDYDYWDHLRTYYRALRARGVQVDVVPPTRDLDGYDAVVGPALHHADADLADHLRSYVDDGGRLLLGARSGVKRPAGRLHDSLAPGPFADLVGARVERHESLPSAIETAVDYDDATYGFRTWGEWLSPDGATSVLAHHRTGEAAGRPAVVRRRVGDGAVTYCGVWPGADLADALASDLLADAGVDAGPRAPTGVRVAERDGHAFVTNFGDRGVRVRVGDASDDATPEWVVGGPDLDPYDVGVVRAPAAAVGVERR